MPVGNASITLADFDGQKGIMAINTATITAANYETVRAAVENLKDASLPITDGQPIQYSIGQSYLLSGSSVKSNVQDSQRGNKWDIQCYDITQDLAAGVPNPYFRKPFNYLLPTADFDLRGTYGNSDVVWQNLGDNNTEVFDDFVAAFEAVAKSPVGGSLNVQVISAVTVSGG